MARNLSSLPVELIDNIARNLSTRSLSAFHRVSRHISAVTAPILHSLPHEPELLRTIEYAANHHNEALMLRLLNHRVTLPTIQRSAACTFRSMVYASALNWQQALALMLANHFPTDSEPGDPAEGLYIDQAWTTPLIAAALGNNPAIVNSLVAAGANLRRYNSFNTCRLLFRTRPATDVISQTLINRGLPLDTLDQFQNSLLIVACSEFYDTEVALILANNADRNHRNVVNNDAMAETMLRDDADPADTIDILRLLIAAGMDVNAGCAGSFTPMHIAVVLEKPEVAQFLLQNGASVDISDAVSRRSLFASLEEADEPSLLQMLLDAGMFVTADPARTILFILHCINTNMPDYLWVLLDYPGVWRQLRTLDCDDLIFIAICGRGVTGEVHDYLQELTPDGGPNRIDVNSNEYGITPLIHASFHDRTDVVTYLVQRAGVTNFDERDALTGRTALHEAVKNANEPLIGLLLPRVAYEDQPDLQGDSPMWDSVITCSAFVTRRLINRMIERAVPVNRIAVSLEVSLETAIARGQLGHVRILVQAFQQLGIQLPDDTFPITTALSEGHDAVALYFANSGIMMDVPFEGRTPLMVAAQLGNRPVLQALLDRGVNLDTANTFGFTALMVAIHHRQNQMAQLLIYAGANLHHVSPAGESALTVAVSADNPAMVRMLNQQGVPYVEGMLPGAAQIGSPELVQAVLSFGAAVDINAMVAPTFRTTLWLAAAGDSAGHEECVRILMEAGADIHLAPGPLGRTPLAAASIVGSVATVTRLLAAGAHPNQAETTGVTPLHLSVSTNGRVIGLLIQAGADVDQATNAGRTPVMTAVERNNPAVLAELIRCGATVHRNIMPLCHPVDGMECAWILMEHGCGPFEGLAPDDGETLLQLDPEGDNDAMIRLLYSRM
ncbi:ankyrin repeat-containing domain protein [Aspergillus californicus]